MVPSSTMNTAAHADRTLAPMVYSLGRNYRYFTNMFAFIYMRYVLHLHLLSWFHSLSLLQPYMKSPYYYFITHINLVFMYDFTQMAHRSTAVVGTTPFVLRLAPVCVKV